MDQTLGFSKYTSAVDFVIVIAVVIIVAFVIKNFGMILGYFSNEHEVKNRMIENDSRIPPPPQKSKPTPTKSSATNKNNNTTEK